MCTWRNKRYILSKLSPWYKGFLIKFCIRNLSVCSFFDKKKLKRVCTRRKNGYKLSKVLLWYRWVFLEFCLISFLVFISRKTKIGVCTVYKAEKTFFLKFCLISNVIIIDKIYRSALIQGVFYNFLSNI